MLLPTLHPIRVYFVFCEQVTLCLFIEHKNECPHVFREFRHASQTLNQEGGSTANPDMTQVTKACMADNSHNYVIIWIFFYS